jgi:hypothetical protein
MTVRSQTFRLEALEPDNLLAFLALLGLLRVLETARPSWRPRAAWAVDNPPLRPQLILAQPEEAMAVCEGAAEGAMRLAENYVFPESAEDGATPQTDLNYQPETARKLLQHVVEGHDRQRSDLWSALMCDAAANADKIEATPLCLLFGQGHQHFLDRLAVVPHTVAPPPRGRGKRTVSLSAAEVLHEALFEPWNRSDPTPSFRWDPAEDVRYALQAEDPSSQKSTTQHGANRLAALALPILTATPASRGERVTDPRRRFRGK